jgi:glycosyltransferase involved in cell wall biosynthesis
MHAIFGAYNDNVHVIPAGMDPHRFNIGTASDRAQADSPTSLKILFAGLVDEAMKGFHVLLAACDQLWHRRQDFEIIVTGEPGRHEAPYLRFVGWLSQLNLVDQLSNCDLLVFPTIAQEALGRTAVEAMASGKPVIASDIGGLSYTVIDGRTGLLARPGDPQDLAKQIERLLDDEPLRLYFGREGRKVFEERYSWPDVIERHYRPLLRARRQSKI